MKFSIVIPNWNGLKLLKKNLPSVLKCGADEVIVCDDGSTDGSVTFIEKNYPQVRVVTHSRLGFAGNINRGVKEAQGEIVVLLNTDVIPQKDFLEPLKKNFNNPKVFAVSFNEVNHPQFSWTKGYFEKGFIVFKSQKKDDQIHQTFWVSGGSGAFRKSIWEKLNGFDETFKFYWEDVDLCYRAQKRGWLCLWDSRSKVTHEHEGTFKKLKGSRLSLIQERNQLLFIWKNLTDSQLFCQHLNGLARRLRHPGYLRVIMLALARVPWLIPQRFNEKKEAKISDRNILSGGLK